MPTKEGPYALPIYSALRIDAYVPLKLVAHRVFCGSQLPRLTVGHSEERNRT